MWYQNRAPAHNNNRYNMYKAFDYLDNCSLNENSRKIGKIGIHQGPIVSKSIFTRNLIFNLIEKKMLLVEIEKPFYTLNESF